MSPTRRESPRRIDDANASTDRNRNGRRQSSSHNPLHSRAEDTGNDNEQTVVAVRMDKTQLAGLSEIQRHLGGNRSDALRSAVEIVATSLSDAAGLETLDRVLGNRVGSRRPVTDNIDPAVAREVRHALDGVARRYAEQAIALQRAGNDWNMIAKLAAAGTPIDTDALRAIERQLTEISSTMARQARNDANLATKVASVF